jgi:protein ImuB
LQEFLVMFACIYGRSLSKINEDRAGSQRLVNLGFTFSPLIEQTTVDTVVCDIEGDEALFRGRSQEGGSGWLYGFADQITKCAQLERLKVNVAIAPNPDAAIHAARAIDEVTVICPGEESKRLANLSLELLDYSLAAVDATKATEIRETFKLWGLRSFGDFACLPLAGVAQRLGQEGVRLQQLARGRSRRHLVAVQLPVAFQQSLELEHPVEMLEPLSFILSRLLNQLCANLNAHALATNELHVQLKLQDQTTHERILTLPVPLRNSKTFLRLCLLDLESHPPQAAVTKVFVSAEPTEPRLLQNGLFVPSAPQPERLELTLARLAKLVGEENVGSPELLDTHRADAFRLKRFAITKAGKQKKSEWQSAIDNRQCIVGFRRFRPPLPAQVITLGDQPIRITARKLDSSDAVQGKIVKSSGPWRTSGDWWHSDVWASDEWDVAVSDTHTKTQILCRLIRELVSEKWFVEGIYD